MVSYCMNRIFHLAFLLDRDGYKRIDLVSFDKLSKLDQFIIERFRNNKDVREKYSQDISEFCLDNMNFIKQENKKNKRNWTGSIAIICDERNNDDQCEKLYKIPIIYQNDKKLLSKENCLYKIKDNLKNKEIVKKIFEEKRYLLSDYEKDLLIKNYSRSDDKYLKSFIGNFYNRLKRMPSDELLYFYCRHLMHICSLNELEIKTISGTIKNITAQVPIDTAIVKKSGYASDTYFNDLIEKENYEELYSLYDLDEIDKNSDLLRGGRK